MRIGHYSHLMFQGMRHSIFVSHQKPHRDMTKKIARALGEKIIYAMYYAQNADRVLYDVVYRAIIA